MNDDREHYPNLVFSPGSRADTARTHTQFVKSLRMKNRGNRERADTVPDIIRMERMAFPVVDECYVTAPLMLALFHHGVTGLRERMPVE
jgi:hypothetical protein